MHFYNIKLYLCKSETKTEIGKDNVFAVCMNIVEQLLDLVTVMLKYKLKVLCL